MRTLDLGGTRGVGVPPMRRGRWFMWVCLTWLLVCANLYARDLPEFREHIVTTGLKYGYQLVAADLTRDGEPDIACIGASTHDVKVYENMDAGS
ncbi:MAG: hypothetical protein KBE65_04035 [Phycisphaerae bacterium]|nr:hypothetical protein [Phycisphaerae bacterium]